jgi:acyl-CoA reductase-like NAD-dependent aldehyde dehydrogenase
MSTERIIVHRSILDSFATALQSATERVYAPTADAPILIASAGVSKNQSLRDDASSKGARILYGTKDSSETSPHRIRPVIISGVTKEMDIFYTESFGPTVSLIAVDSDEEAIELANDTEYGLSGAVFTKSLARGLKIAREVEAGAVHINSMTVHDEAGLPHGGAKRSGFGRFNAQWGVEEFLRLKTVSYMEG